MAFDKLIDSTRLDGALSATANAIREKTGGTDLIEWEASAGFASAISEIQTIPDAVEQATPTISVSSAGLITASATQTEGFVVGGTKSATKQLSTQAAATITPGTSNKTAVASGKYTTGAVMVKGDANLKAANIAKGVSIFGVTGSLASAKVATGSVTFSTTGVMTNPHTIQGLGFKPTFIIMYVKPSTVVNWEQYDGYAPWDGVALYTVYADGETSTVYPEWAVEENYDEEEGEYYDYEYVSASAGSNLKITPTDDGFTLSATNYIAFWEHEAQFVAIG